MHKPTEDQLAIQDYLNKHHVDLRAEFNAVLAKRGIPLVIGQIELLGSIVPDAEKDKRLQAGAELQPFAISPMRKIIIEVPPGGGDCGWSSCSRGGQECWCCTR